MVTSGVEHSADEVSQDSISCPPRSDHMISILSTSMTWGIHLLCEDAEAAVASQSVTRAGFLEQSAVIPPALVGAIHVQEVFVFSQL